MALAVLAACLPSGAALAADGALKVFAATAMRPVLEALPSADGADLPEIEAVYGPAGRLAQRVADGEAVDLLIVDNPRWLNFLRPRNRLLDLSRRAIAGDRLALIARADSPLDVPLTPRLPLGLLLDGGKLAVADADIAPAGGYARDGLATLEIWRALHDRLLVVDDVAQVVAAVADGDASAGIAYASSAQADDRVRVVNLFPPHAHRPIRFEAAAIRGGDTVGARLLLDYLTGENGRELITRQGFTLP